MRVSIARAHVDIDPDHTRATRSGARAARGW
jgi:hypothetical protein